MLEERHLAHHVACPQRGDRDGVRPGALEDLELPLEHDVEGVAASPLPHEQLPGGDVERPGAGVEALEIVLGQLGEEARAAEQLDAGRRGLGGRLAAHTEVRYWWTKRTAIAPSPTADAIRLIDSWRTSPATKMPGTLASSR